ncbi:maltose excess protein 1-like, chloroplastic [Musa acuminata AAA Group]|uniref:maltose excess protein 1-like, chloroplastic n=1 Tax=Musa acuminata AAA Group TaxID=214697 RepID=UPI0031D3FAFA
MTSPPPASLSAAPLRFHLLASTIQLSFPPKCCPVAARNLSIRRRFRSSCAFASHSPPPSAASQRWDTLTARFAGASNLPFLLIQLPQILLNYRNLVSGNKAALLAVPWLGMLTGLLGNMTLLSYFAKKKEVEAIVVQTLGVVSIYVVLGQLAMAEAMSLPYFAAISVLVVSGLVLNFVNYFGWLHEGLWQLWEDFITVAGISVLPQVMWSTFVPFIPKSILPGTICCIIAVGAIILARLGKLSDRMVKFIRSISGWTATLLFMWMPIAQMWTTYLNPDNIKGLSAFTILLGMIGNGLMIPRALFIRDLMWFTGASWASFLHGWGNLACMYYFKSISWKFFLGATLSLFVWTGIALWRDTKAYGYSSPMISLQELVSGT